MLRKLLASAIVSGDPYPLLEALVEAVEPEDTCAECEFYINLCCSNAPGYLGGWKFTKPNATECKRFIASSSEPEDTDATIRKLRKEIESWRATGWPKRAHNAEQELAEAKAEIERLKVLISDLTDRGPACYPEGAR